MTRIASDPLLALAKVLLLLMAALLILLMAAVAIGAGAAMTVARSDVTALLTEAGVPASSYWLVLAALAIVFAMLFASFRFVRELGRIVASVGEGDPFLPRNADRLARMGWLTLGIQAGVALIFALTSWLDRYTDEAHRLSVDAGVSFNGLVLALVLFILARVFRRGAEMREDLEGTV